VRHECCDYQTDSGGAGKWRGGCGSRIVKRLTTDATVNSYLVGRKYPMPGMRGGKDGSPNQLTLHVGTDHAEVVAVMASAVPHRAGEAFEYLYGGGGGFGDPLERDPAKVLDDVLDEYVSIEGARRDYGVVLRGSLEAWDLEVDEPATAALRESRR
jgi:N-methylhydantoinase B